MTILKKSASASVAPMTPDDVRRITREESARILMQMARQLAGETDHYSTQGGDRHAPPEYQGRPKRWRADAATIPGAVRVGRWWTVSRAAYSAWLESQRTTPAPEPARPWSPEDSLIGLRMLGGSK